MEAGEPPDSSSTLGKILLFEAGPIGWGKLAVDAAKPKPLPAMPPLPSNSLLQPGESTTLKPGQKLNGVMTSPQGLLGAPTVGRQSLLGN